MGGQTLIPPIRSGNNAPALRQTVATFLPNTTDYKSSEPSDYQLATVAVTNFSSTNVLPLSTVHAN